MKKTLIALAALAATGAFAQLTISGSMQVGIIDSGAANSNAKVASLGGGANAINMSAAENIGDGLKVGWQGQIRYDGATGDVRSAGQGSALFHDAYIFMSSPVGTVRLGKIAEVSNGVYDPWLLQGGASMGAGEGLSMLVGASPEPNSVWYHTPTIAGFSASLQKTMSPTAGTAGGRTNERSMAKLDYNNGPMSAQILVASGLANTAPNSTNFPTAPVAAVADNKSSQRSLAASYDFMWAKFNLVNVTNKNAADVKTADITSVSTVVPLGGPLQLLAGYNKAKNIGTYNSANDTKVAVGINYAVSRRTTLGADLFKAENVGASTGFVLRAKHTF